MAGRGGSTLCTDAGVDQNFQRDSGAIGPYELQGTSVCTNPLVPCFQGESVWTNGAESLTKDSLETCELFFPLEGPESLRGGDPQKMGKNYKIPLPGPTPEIREKSPKKGVKLLRKYKFCNFSVIFP